MDRIKFMIKDVFLDKLIKLQSKNIFINEEGFIKFIKSINEYIKEKNDELTKSKLVCIIIDYLKIHINLTKVIYEIFCIHDENIINNVCKLLEENKIRFDEHVTELLIYMRKMEYIIKYDCFTIKQKTINILIKRSSLYPVNNEAMFLFNIARKNNDVNIVYRVLDNMINFVNTFVNILICTDEAMKYIDKNIYEKFKDCVDSINNVFPIPVDIKCLEKACTLRHMGLIKYIVNKKIIPTHECFESLFKIDGRGNKYFGEIFYGKYIKILVDYGYVITYNDMYYITSKYIRLNDTYGIKIDRKFDNLCKLKKLKKYNY